MHWLAPNPTESSTAQPDKKRPRIPIVLLLRVGDSRPYRCSDRPEGQMSIPFPGEVYTPRPCVPRSAGACPAATAQLGSLRSGESGARPGSEPRMKQRSRRILRIEPLLQFDDRWKGERS